MAMRDNPPSNIGEAFYGLMGFDQMFGQPPAQTPPPPQQQQGYQQYDSMFDVPRGEMYNYFRNKGRGSPPPPQVAPVPTPPLPAPRVGPLMPVIQPRLAGGGGGGNMPRFLSSRYQMPEGIFSRGSLE